MPTTMPIGLKITITRSDLILSSITCTLRVRSVRQDQAYCLAFKADLEQ